MCELQLSTEPMLRAKEVALTSLLALLLSHLLSSAIPVPSRLHFPPPGTEPPHHPCVMHSLVHSSPPFTSNPPRLRADDGPSEL